MFNKRETEKMYKDHERRIKELSIQESKLKMENNRLTEEMRNNHEFNSKKEDHDYLKGIRELDDRRELNNYQKRIDI